MLGIVEWRPCVSVLAITVFWCRESESGEAIAAVVKTVVRVLMFDDLLHQTNVTVDFGLGHVEGEADIRFYGDTVVIGSHLRARSSKL